MSLQYFLGVEAETALYSLLVPSEPSLSIYFHLRFFYGTYLSFPSFCFCFYSIGSAAIRICSQKFAGAASLLSFRILWWF